MSEFETAFLETNYNIHFQDGETINLRIGEQPLYLLNKLPHLETWAFVTAWNPLPDILTKEENDLRNSQLHEKLIQLEFIVHHGVGVSKDGNWQEDSFFIENIDKETAKEVSGIFGQLAFVFGHKTDGNTLIYTVTSNELK
jgi:hypothetical protein